ncbi:MAG: MFS transporter [Spirochaetales bacterium]|nr:MFS transporter [Spirochaetales bacterium]
MDVKVTQLNKARWWEIGGFSFNNASTNAVWALITTYYLVYTTEIYGFPAVLVGAIMMGTRIFDAFTDPIIGVLIDRTHSRFGRFRPWILGGAILSSLMIVLMFSGIRTGSYLGDLILALGLYSIWVLGYTAQTACTKSAQNIISSVPKQRSIINALGSLNTVLVQLAALVIVLPVVKAMGGTKTPLAWATAGSIFGGIQLLYAVFSVLGLMKKDVPEHLQKVESKGFPKFADYVAIFRSNKALQMLIVAASSNKITQSMQSGLIVLLFYYVARNPDLQGIVTSITVGLGVIAMLLMIKPIERFGRKEVFTLSSWGGFLYGIAAIFLVALAPQNPVWLIIVASVNMILIAGTGEINIISMVGDAADYEHYISGRFIPGMIGASFSLIDKLISSFGSLIIGAILSAIGFVSVSETAPSDILFWGVLIMYFGFPALGHLCSILAMKYYPLDKKTHWEMLEALARDEKL